MSDQEINKSPGPDLSPDIQRTGHLRYIMALGKKPGDARLFVGEWILPVPNRNIGAIGNWQPVAFRWTHSERCQ
jgi:hypothetical protein